MSPQSGDDQNYGLDLRTSDGLSGVDRGGSWMFPAWLLRPATRERNSADYRNAIMGFRVAKTLRETGSRVRVFRVARPAAIEGVLEK